MKQPSESVPAIVGKAHLNGGRTTLFTGTFFSAYWQNRFPDYLRLVNALCLEDEDFPVRVEGAPRTVQVLLRRTIRSEPEQALLIHPLNQTGEMQRPIEEVLPVNDLIVRVARDFLAEQVGAECGRVRVRCLPQALPVTLSDDDHSLAIRVPRLER